MTHPDVTHPSRLITPDIRRFLLQAVAWNIAFFGLLQLTWIEQHVVGAIIEFQKTLVTWYGVAAHKGILVNASCSGTDVMALSAGLTLAYPAPWRRRFAGAACGLVVILTLNAIRIATLYRAASDPARLELLHLYVWPAALAVATAAYLFAWICWSERKSPLIDADRRWVRFGLFAAGSLAVYAASVPWVFASPLMAEMGTWTVGAGGAVLSLLGASATTTGNVLMTGRGAFQVTPECLYTPMTALYFAAVFALSASRRRRLGWLLLGLPLFFAFGVTRLLVLALPPFVADSPVFLAHGFYQIVAGASAIIVAAHVSIGASRDTRAGLRASGRTVAALAAALAGAILLGPVWESALVRAAHLVQAILPMTIAALGQASDRQGALALLPAFQVGCAIGLWMAVTGGRNRRRLLTALAVLAGSQLAFLVALGIIRSGLEIEPHALVIRGWALVVPLVIAAGWGAAGATLAGDRRYRGFWHDVGATFPDLRGAASTNFYFENEKRLITDALGDLTGRTLLKTDLWDEAKNTRILQWMSAQGARVVGIDVSEPIVRQARAAFEPSSDLRSLVSDVRQLPFEDRSFDAIYSMGTVEHFAETEASVKELARILKPGGRLILGVPNRHDPFLRPLLVIALRGLGRYAYGYEKSYSRRSLRRMLMTAGLDVRLESGILFIPGWLRMLDLWCHTRAPQLTRLTAALVQPFVWLDRRVPALRRHGYLIAAVGEQPALAGAAAAVAPAKPRVAIGVEYVVDARGCDPEALRSLPRLQALFARLLDELALEMAAAPVWHVFPGHGGITGIVLLAESHLAIHTFPESGCAAIDLYCCRRSADWPWAERLAESLGASDVDVKVIRRG